MDSQYDVILCLFYAFLCVCVCVCVLVNLKFPSSASFVGPKSCISCSGYPFLYLQDISLCVQSFQNCRYHLDTALNFMLAAVAS